MLSKIFIQNFALIDTLEIDLKGGFQVITGETGAGKSIILGALRLIMGDRANIKTLDNSQKIIVETTFILDELKFKALFEEKDLDFEIETVIRREITPQGKSRAFVNDIPVTLSTLQELSEKLIDIHSQFENSNIFSKNYQFDIIDGIIKNNDLFKTYQKEFNIFIETKNKLKKLQNQIEEEVKQADYQNYLLDELKAEQLENLNFEAIKAELLAQENSENIMEKLSKIYHIINFDEIGILQQINEIIDNISKITGFSEKYSEMYERINSVSLELKDISDLCERELDKIQINPEIIENLTIKVNNINNLFIKHKVQNIKELLQIQKELEEKLDKKENLLDKIEEYINFIDKQKIKLKKIASELTDKRILGSKIFAEKSSKILDKLGLENAKIEVQLTESEDFNEYGLDNINFLFQANSGYNLRPIQDAISGGERSRVMLAIKKIVAENSELPTLILDEIDTGVSGRIAEEIGNLMREMGKNMQLIAITHLPQVAAKGNNNYKVLKYEQENKAKTTIIPLSDNEKLQEIAQLLSGNKITEAAIKQAKELIVS